MTYFHNSFLKSFCNKACTSTAAPLALGGSATYRLTSGIGGCRSFRPVSCGGMTFPPTPPFSPPHCPVPPPPGFRYPVDGQAIAEDQPIFSGTAEGGAPVRLCVDGVCAETMSDMDGIWNIPSPVILTLGTHIASASQRNFCGETSTANTISFSVESLAPPSPDVITPAEGQAVPGPYPFFSGTAIPGNTIRVCIGGVCRTTVADAGGNWSLTWDQPVMGQTTAEIVQIGESGIPSEPVIRHFVSLSDENLLQISNLRRGSVFRSVDVTLTPIEMDGDWRLYYILHEPNVPNLTPEEIIGPADSDLFTSGWYVRGMENISGNQMGLILTIPLRGRNTPYTTPNEVGVLDGFPYVVQMIAVSSTGEQSNEAQYLNYAIGMPFDGGEGTPENPFLLRELSISELSNYPDLLAASPLNRSGVNETARQLDNIEGMRNEYEGNPQHGMENSLQMNYRMITSFNLAGYQNAYNGDGWRPIGNYDLTFDNPAQADHIFMGTMTADPSKPITNLYLTPVGNQNRHVQYIGLFGYIMDATITGLYVQNAYIRPQPYAPTVFLSFLMLGALCGLAESSSFITVGAENVQFVTNFSATQNWNIRSGAIVGTLYGGEIDGASCTNVTVAGRPGTTSYHGAVAGEFEDYPIATNMSNVHVDGFTVTGVDWDVASLGGAVGIIRGGYPSVIEDISIENINMSGIFGDGGGLLGTLTDVGGKTIRNININNINIESGDFDADVGGLIGYCSLREYFRMSDISVRSAVVRSRINTGGVFGTLALLEEDLVELSGIDVLVNADSEDGRAGGLIGALFMETYGRIYIHDCNILEGTNIDGSGLCGGMIGEFIANVSSTDPLFIENSISAANVTATSSDAGGFVGYGEGVIIRNCLFTGYASSPFHVGGIIGFSHGCSISGCSVSGSIEYSYLGGGLIGGCDHLATLAASAASPFPFTGNLIEKSNMRGSFIGTPGYACGGLAGRLTGISVDQCFSNANLSAPTGTDVSALVGLANYYTDISSEIRNSYSTGSVTGAPQGAGGLASSSGYRILTSYHAGSVYSSTQCGGIVGNPETQSLVERCLVMSPVVSSQSSNPLYAGRIGSANGSYLSNYALDTVTLIKGGIPVAPIVNPNGSDGGTYTAAQTASMLSTLGWDTANIWNTATIATLGRPTLLNNPE